MRIFSFITILFLISSLTFSQITENDEVTYIDSLGGNGTFENYKFLRIIKNLKIPNQEPYEIKEYYKSGKLAMTGAIIPGKNTTRFGSFIYFHENGNKKSTEIYNEGVLKTQYDFYENGQKMMTIEYLPDMK